MHFIIEWSVDVKHISSFTFRSVLCIVINCYDKLIVLCLCPQIYISQTYFCPEDSSKCSSIIRAIRRASVECYELCIARTSKGDSRQIEEVIVLLGFVFFLGFTFHMVVPFCKLQVILTTAIKKCYCGESIFVSYCILC